MSPAAILRAATFLVLWLVFSSARETLNSAFWILNGINLAFHEAGHLIFGILGIEFIMVAGGTLMQLLLPLAALVQFRKQDQKKSADAVLFWIGQNFIGIGIYMADARAQVLPLVGGGEHDWTFMFEKLGVLTHDVGIGHSTEILGCGIMAYAISSLAQRMLE